MGFPTAAGSEAWALDSPRGDDQGRHTDDSGWYTRPGRAWGTEGGTRRMGSPSLSSSSSFLSSWPATLACV